MLGRLQNLPSTADSAPLVRRDGEWLVGGAFTSEDLPDELVESTATTAQRMRYDQARGALLAVRVPLPQVPGSTYFEIVPLDELESSLQSLALTLAVAGVVTTTVGAAIGWWASSRVMRPITDVSSAAQAIAGGATGHAARGAPRS